MTPEELLDHIKTTGDNEHPDYHAIYNIINQHQATTLLPYRLPFSHLENTVLDALKMPGTSEKHRMLREIRVHNALGEAQESIGKICTQTQEVRALRELLNLYVQSIVTP